MQFYGGLVLTEKIEDARLWCKFGELIPVLQKQAGNLVLPEVQQEKPFVFHLD